MKAKIIICLSMLFLLALPISLAETFQDDEAGLENYDTLPLEYFYNPETAIIDYPLAKPVVQGIPMSLSSFANLDVKLKKAANLGVALVDETTFLKSLNMDNVVSPEQMGTLF